MISTEKIQKATEELENPVNSAKVIEKDLMRQADQLAEHTLEVAYRSAERNAILERVVFAKEAIREATQKLDAQQQTDLERQQQLNAMERRLAELIEQQGDAPPEEKSPIILQHLPTPMAKTVFGRELHLMVRDGMITVIPWDRLVSMLKVEARTAVARSTRRERITEQLGPIDGFVMDFTLVSKRGLVSNGSATSMAQVVELDKFELETTADVIQEPLSHALGRNGRLRMELASYPPRESTVTAWVYPNSFETFRQLKGLLFEEGYMAAARPMPEGMRIGASPRGTQSAAQ
jgi:hypothetical protein